MMTNLESADEFYPFTAAQLPDAEECCVLDLGCGTGLELESYYFAVSDEEERDFRLWKY